MIDLILTSPGEGPATLFTRNFRVHAGIPVGLYEGGPRAPVVLVYGDISPEVLAYFGEHYEAVIGVPSIDNDGIPEDPFHYETMTVKAPILARVQNVRREGFHLLIRTSEGDPLVLEGLTGKKPTILFTADLIKSTIRILSGELERNTGQDRFGRHNPAPESVIYAPGVSFHFNLIENIIHYIYKKLGLPLFFLPRWPKSAPLALFLSHDVDVVRKWTLKRSLQELGKDAFGLFRLQGKQLWETASSIANAVRGRDPYWMFDELQFMEHGHGFSSTWFFAPFSGEYRKREHDFDPVYRRKGAEITAMIRRLVDDGCEIALHGTRRAFLDAGVLRKQIESFESRLGISIRGVRHHYLMFRHGQTLEAASACGLLYDTTLGFSDRPGFRNGIAAPFFPYPVSHPAGSIVELPLVFMDGVFLYTGGDYEGMCRRVTESYLYAKAAGGMFSILVHPGNLDDTEVGGLAKFYRSFLPRCRLDRACSMTGSNLARWWTARERVLKALEYGDNTWRIRGVDIPENMDFVIFAPDIRRMKFSIEGATGSSEVNHEKLIIRPHRVDPEKGLIFIRKN